MKLSVIIPVYNVEPYLRECLDSVVNQTYKHLEIILVNDGSTDNSGEICKEYANKDERIIYVEKENGGLVSAYTTGYKHASCEYVTFVDSDDYIELNMYESMLNKFIEYSDIDLVMCGYGRFSNSANFKKTDLGIKEGIQYTKDKQYFYRMNSHFVSSSRWNKIYKKSILDDIINNLDYNINFAEDLLVSIPYFMTIKKFYYVDKVFYNYRFVEKSISRNVSKTVYDDICKVMQKLLEFDQSQHYFEDIYETVLELFSRELSLIVSNSKNKELYKFYVNSKEFKLVKSINWKTYNIKQKLLKFNIKYCPMLLYYIYKLKYGKKAVI